MRICMPDLDGEVIKPRLVGLDRLLHLFRRGTTGDAPQADTGIHRAGFKNVLLKQLLNCLSSLSDRSRIARFSLTQCSTRRPMTACASRKGMPLL